MALLTSNKVFFDLETNGFGGSGSIYNSFHRVVQISARIGENSFCVYVDPEVHIPAPSTAIHGIADSDVEGQPTFDHAFAGFVKFIYKHTNPNPNNVDTILIAHNAFGFDVPMLQKECARVGVLVPPEFYIYDTLPIYRREFPDRSSKRLGDLYCACFGREMENAHDALADSIALQKLFLKELLPQHFKVSDVRTFETYSIVRDEDAVQSICGIGPATSWKIGQLLSKTAGDHRVLVGDLRSLMRAKTDEQIERFIRNDLLQHNESFVFSIWYAITQGHGKPPWFYFSGRSPSYNEAFFKYWGSDTASCLMKANIGSAEMLRRYYFYVLREDDEALAQFAKSVRSELYLLKMIITV